MPVFGIDCLITCRKVVDISVHSKIFYSKPVNESFFFCFFFFCFISWETSVNSYKAILLYSRGSTGFLMFVYAITVFVINEIRVIVPTVW